MNTHLAVRRIWLHSAWMVLVAVTWFLTSGRVATAQALSAAMTTDSNRLTVFARGQNSTLIHRYYDPDKQVWTDWIRLGGEVFNSEAQPRFSLKID